MIFITNLTILFRSKAGTQMFYQTFSSPDNYRAPVGGLLYEKGGDARWEISIETLKSTNLGVV